MNFDPHQIIGIYGMGVEGQSLFSWLQKKKVKNIFCFDDKNIGEPLTTEQKENFKELFSKQSVINKKNNNKNHDENHDENIIPMEYGYKLPLSYLPLMEKIFRSPGVHPKKIIQYIGEENINKISSSTQLFFNISPTTNIIGITGTKGKGTTSSLIYEICKEYYKIEKQKNIFLGGNIGTPIFDFFDDIKKDDIVILEMSSFQLYDLKKSPTLSVLLRTDSEHLDWHSDVKDYRGAKKNIFLHQKKNNILIYFDGDSITSQLVSDEKIIAQKISVFSHKEKQYIDIKNNKIISTLSSDENYERGESDESNIFTTDIALRGDFQQENVLAALAVVQSLNIPNNISKKIISTFIGLPMRCEIIAEKNGRFFFNDSFSTIPETTISALSTFSSPLFLIVGGSEKNSNFTQLSEYIAKDKNIKKIYLIGITAERIKKSITEACEKNNSWKTIEMKNNFQEIFSDFKKNSKKGDSLLMSPACASFGMFKNYYERGNVFNSFVEKF